MDTPLRCLLWGILVLRETWAGPGSHTLQYMHTGWTRPEVWEPRFVTVGYVNHVEFVRFDSDPPSPRVTPRVAWMERVAQEDPEYWERNTWIGKSNTRVYQAGLDTMQGYHNQSQGRPHDPVLARLRGVPRRPDPAGHFPIRLQQPGLQLLDCQDLDLCGRAPGRDLQAPGGPRERIREP